MTVDRYEMGLTEVADWGFDASHLGSAYPGEKGNCTLIAALGEYIPEGSVNSFVVFVTNTALWEQDIQYEWTLDRSDSESGNANSNADGYPMRLSTTSGRMQWRAINAGAYKVVVNLYSGSNELLDEVKIDSIVYSASEERLLEEFQLLEKGTPNHICFVGDLAIARRVVFDFGIGPNSYFEYGAIFADNDVSRKFLASLAYTALLTWRDGASNPVHEPLSSNVKPNWNDGAMRELKAPLHLAEAIDADRRLGLCRVIPMYAAAALGLIDAPGDLTFGAKGRRKANESLRQSFENLPEIKRNALYNLLRFPKSNILIAARILQNHLREWPKGGELQGKSLTDQPDIAKSRKHRQFLAMLYLFGGKMLCPKNKSKSAVNYLIEGAFASSVASNYLLAAFDVFLLADNSNLKGYQQEWLDWSDSTYRWSMGPGDGAGFRKLPLSSHFSNGFTQYAFLRRRYHEFLREKFPDEYAVPGNSDCPANPMEWLAEYICDMVNPFAPDGGLLTTHIDLRDRLLAAHARIPASVPCLLVDSIVSFVPRMIANTERKDWSLSYHATGLAIDIDPDTNPQIFTKTMDAINSELRRRVDENGNKFNPIDWSKRDLAALKSADATWKVLAALICAEGEALVTMGSDDKWTPLEHCAAIIPAFEKMWYPKRKVKRPKDPNRRGCLLEIHDAIINALVDEGFDWGGRWNDQRDFMHFQLKQQGS